MDISCVQGSYSYSDSSYQNVHKNSEKEESQKSSQESKKMEDNDVSDKTYVEMIQEKVEELYTKIKNGDTEQSFRIGAQSFTKKEWDKLLKQVDDAEDAIRKLIEQEKMKRDKKEEQKEIAESDFMEKESLEEILNESTISWQSEEGSDEPVMHITWYTKEGIFCRRAGQTEGYEWSIPFENESEYDTVMAFIDQHGPDDVSFASREDFWRDFLKENGEETE